MSRSQGVGTGSRYANLRVANVDNAVSLILLDKQNKDNFQAGASLSGNSKEMVIGTPALRHEDGKGGARGGGANKTRSCVARCSSSGAVISHD